MGDKVIPLQPRRDSDDNLVLLPLGGVRSSLPSTAAATGTAASSSLSIQRPSASSSSSREAPEPHRLPLGQPSMSSQNYEDNESELARLYEEERRHFHRHAVITSTHTSTTSTSTSMAAIDLEEAATKTALKWQTRKRSLLRWLINLSMAVIIEIIYLSMSYSSSTLLKSKASLMLHAAAPGSKYAVKLFFSCLYSSIAFAMVYMVPTAAGSGIPETKAFLNGIRIPNMQSLRTLTAKIVGTVFAVAAGLPLGKYGAMIHIGSIVAAFMSRGARGIKQIDRLFDTFRLFSTHSEKRDLVVSGAASGVTAAFGAPIGGLMLAWEEGSSYWSLKVSWRVFFCAMSTLLFTYLVADSKVAQGSSFVNQSYVESYAGSFSTGIRVANRDLLFFAGMGVLGGLMGATHNFLHKQMSAFRKAHVATWPRKYAEVVGVTFLVITVGFVASYYSERWACRPLPPKDPSLYEDAEYVMPYFNGLLRLTCPAGYYNEVASLYLNDGVTALRLVFHLPRLNPVTGDPMFSLAALGLFVLPYFCFLVLTFGTALPCGFFVPQLLVGAVLGRMLGEVAIRHGYPTYFGQVRIFAIMGSAAFVGGISRMVLSMTVIMLEATGDLFFLMPFAVVLLVSHWVGDLFTPSIYDMIIQMKGYPFLRPDPPKWALGRLRASDLMTKPVVSLRPIESVRRVREVLYATEHNLFPLVYPPSHSTRPGALFGTVMRESLVVLVQAAAFSSTAVANTDPDSPDLASPVLEYPEMLKLAARLSTREIARPNLPLSREDEEKWIDLRPYSNPSVYFVTEDSSVSKVYKLFRGLGLRHLLVIDVARNISGIITRYDLMPKSMEVRLQEIHSGMRRSSTHWMLPPSKLRQGEEEEEEASRTTGLARMVGA